MIEINISRLLLAMLIGICVTVGFDAILHGLSHGGHGFLDSIWQNEKAQRVTSSKLFSSIFWHIFSDILLGLLLSLMFAFLRSDHIITYILIGFIIGLIMAVVWIHVYAAFEVSVKVVISLAFLAIIQSTLASFAIGWFYRSG